MKRPIKKNVRAWAGSILLLLFFLVTAGTADAEVFAAAASLQPVMEKIAQEFEKEKGIRMDAVFASSGQLAKQIEMGAPYDLFLSADERWARYLEEKGKLEKVRPVAECPLVLWRDSAEAPSLDLVKDKKIRLAIADPEVAPYGALAREYLEKIGEYEDLDKDERLIIAGDVLKAGLAAKSGGADAAYIPLSIAKKLEGSWTKVPMPPQRLFGGIVKDRDALAALVFYDYLFSPRAADLFRKAGFEPVQD
ncbi:MAG: Molybdenum ABC transporter, periplasmic molybdate-binding protein [Synergistales bacterium 58_81]|nr:MAG: Molybdenum ABC transporter, periplasmic molybdate-binding protein [Synergistales bacterium 58_81]